MSEQNSSSGFSFTEFSGGGDMDFDAIFGGASGGPGDVNPFEAALAQQPEPASAIPQATPQTAASQPEPQAVQPPADPAPPVFQSVQVVQSAPAPTPAAASAAPADQPPLDIDPLAAAMAEQEAKTEQKVAKSLFEKPQIGRASCRERV